MAAGTARAGLRLVWEVAGGELAGVIALFVLLLLLG